jgi:hypothetical protein
MCIACRGVGWSALSRHTPLVRDGKRVLAKPNLPTFAILGRLAGLVPLDGRATGSCFSAQCPGVSAESPHSFAQGHEGEADPQFWTTLWPCAQKRCLTTGTEPPFSMKQPPRPTIQLDATGESSAPRATAAAQCNSQPLTPLTLPSAYPLSRCE